MPRSIRIRRQKTKKTKRKTRRGGAIIGKGTYGCVYQPALRCANSEPADNNVSKLINSKYLSSEKGPEKLAAINAHQNFFVYPYNDCSFNPVIQTSYNRPCNVIKNPVDAQRLLIMKYGGINLENIRIPANGYYKIFKGMSNVFEGINLLHTNGLVHHDIKPRNIVVKEEGDAYKIRLIDFGFSQSYENLKEHYKADSPLSSAYQFPYIYWPFYAFVFGLQRAQIADAAFLIGYDNFYRRWLEMINKYGTGIPEDHYFSTPAKFYTHVDYSTENFEKIKTITGNPDAYFAFAKNVDIYSLAITLSELFYKMFRVKSIWNNHTKNIEIVVYSPDDDDFIPYNSNFGNATLNAWIGSFVETVAKPFYELILKMTDYNTIEAPRDIMVYKTKYETEILPQIKAAIYDETGTKLRGFVKYLNVIVPRQFSVNASTPYERTPSRPVHTTGRGVNASAAVNSPNLSPIPEERNNNEAFF